MTAHAMISVCFMLVCAAAYFEIVSRALIGNTMLSNYDAFATDADLYECDHHLRLKGDLYYADWYGVMQHHTVKRNRNLYMLVMHENTNLFANKWIIPLWNKLVFYEEDGIMDVFIRNPGNIVPIHITSYSDGLEDLMGFYVDTLLLTNTKPMVPKFKTTRWHIDSMKEKFFKIFLYPHIIKEDVWGAEVSMTVYMHLCTQERNSVTKKDTSSRKHKLMKVFYVLLDNVTSPYMMDERSNHELPLLIKEIMNMSLSECVALGNDDYFPCLQATWIYPIEHGHLQEEIWISHNCYIASKGVTNREYVLRRETRIRNLRNGLSEIFHYFFTNQNKRMEDTNNVYLFAMKTKVNVGSTTEPNEFNDGNATSEFRREFQFLLDGNWTLYSRYILNNIFFRYIVRLTVDAFIFMACFNFSNVIPTTVNVISYSTGYKFNDMPVDVFVLHLISALADHCIRSIFDLVWKRLLRFAAQLSKKSRIDFLLKMYISNAINPVPRDSRTNGQKSNSDSRSKVLPEICSKSNFYEGDFPSDRKLQSNATEDCPLNLQKRVANECFVDPQTNMCTIENTEQDNTVSHFEHANGDLSESTHLKSEFNKDDLTQTNPLCFDNDRNDETFVKTFDENDEERSQDCLTVNNINDVFDLNISPRNNDHFSLVCQDCDSSLYSKENDRSDILYASTNLDVNTVIVTFDNSHLSTGPTSVESSSTLKSDSFYNCCQKDKDMSFRSKSSSSVLSFTKSFVETQSYSNTHDAKSKLIKLNTSLAPVEETSRTHLGNLSKIVTSHSVYVKPTQCYTETLNSKTIAKRVKTFFRHQKIKRHRRFQRISRRRLRQCLNYSKILHPETIICNPVHKNSSSHLHPIQNENHQSDARSGTDQTLLYSRETLDSDTQHGPLMSMFNTFSIDSLHEDQRFNFEWMRLASFANFESQLMQAIPLARNGWYSTGNRDQTVCFSCHRVHENWTRTDNPSSFHDLECRFLNNSSNNVSIPRDGHDKDSHANPQAEHKAIATDLVATNLSPYTTAVFRAERIEELSANRESNNTAVSRDEHREELLPNLPSVSRPETMVLSSSESTKQSQLEALKNDPMGINFDRPKYSQYAICSVRVSSFSGWPSCKSQTPRDLAIAGFFYVGHGDYTRCFFCGGGLRNWEEGDDPWVEHARWFSQCAFVRQNKGQDFIDLVLQRAQELEREQTCNPQNSLSENQHSNDQRVMNSEAVLTIKRMGYTEDKIRNAIETLKSRLPRGKHKVSAHDILEVILEIESSNARSTLSKNNEVGRPDRQSTTENVKQTTTFTDQKDDEIPDCIAETSHNDWTPEALENEGLKGQILCKICMEKKVSIAFLPCSHLVCCEDCAPAMRICPFCRKFIKGTVKTFLV